MSFGLQFPVNFSCNRNVSFNLFGFDANWGCITSISGAIVVLILILAYLFFLSRQDVHLEIPNNLTEPDVPNLQSRQLFRGNEKIKERENLFPSLLKPQHQKQDIKVDIDMALAAIIELNQTLKTQIPEIIQQLNINSLTRAQAKGGFDEELLLEERLTQLPHDWVAKNTANGLSLRAPNGRSIPIYSKWTNTELLTQVRQATSNSQKHDIKKKIHDEVVVRAKESVKNLGNEHTLGFHIVAVPDSVFDLCLDLQVRLAAGNIVLISYSLLVPYILLIVNLFLKNSQSTQALQISHILSRATAQIELIQNYVDTQVKVPLDTVSLQQTQYGRYNQQLQIVDQRLSQIQNALVALQKSLPIWINPLPNADITSIPKTLKHYLTQLREGLLESFTEQNIPDQNNTNK